MARMVSRSAVSIDLCVVCPLSSLFLERFPYAIKFSYFYSVYLTLRACSPYRLMKSAIVVPQEEANIEKNLSMTIIYIHRLEIISRNFGCWISNLGRCTIVTNDVFPHRLSPAERGHRTDINSSS